MFENQNRVIIVDNVQTELDQLGKSFFVNGLGCRTFLYSPEYYEPLTNVRLAFFDVNLTAVNANVSPEDTIAEILEKCSQVFNDLAVAISQYISLTNGPFALIFWTKNSSLIEAFKIYMQVPERNFNDTIAKPIFIGHLDKVDLAEEDSTLSERVINLLNREEKIKVLFDFEENARIAGEKTINRIYDVLPKDQLWGENTVLYQNIDSVFSKISASTLGFDHAKENPKKAIYEGLIPLLNYELINATSDVKWDEIVNSLINANRFSDIIIPDTSIQNKVNSLYHIEDFTDQLKDTRGCVIRIDKNDKAVLDSLNIKNFSNWFGNLIPIDDNAKRRSVRASSILVAIEISAACDYSNRKERINKYIIGLLCSNLDYKNDTNKDRRSESCYHLGGCYFNINDLDYQLCLNLNFVFSAMSDDIRLGDLQFILKKEIMDMLGNKYASHISRIGITSF